MDEVFAFDVEAGAPVPSNARCRFARRPKGCQSRYVVASLRRVRLSDLDGGRPAPAILHQRNIGGWV